jgi:hypothetical protein
MASSVPGTLLPNDEELMETIVTEGARAADSSAAHRPAPPAAPMGTGASFFTHFFKMPRVAVYMEIMIIIGGWRWR